MKYEVFFEIETLKASIHIETYDGLNIHAVTDALDLITNAHRFEFAVCGQNKRDHSMSTPERNEQ